MGGCSCVPKEQPEDDDPYNPMHLPYPPIVVGGTLQDQASSYINSSYWSNTIPDIEKSPSSKSLYRVESLYSVNDVKVVENVVMQHPTSPVPSSPYSQKSLFPSPKGSPTISPRSDSFNRQGSITNSPNIKPLLQPSMPPPPLVVPQPVYPNFSNSQLRSRSDGRGSPVPYYRKTSRSRSVDIPQYRAGQPIRFRSAAPEELNTEESPINEREWLENSTLVSFHSFSNRPLSKPKRPSKRSDLLPTQKQNRSSSPPRSINEHYEAFLKSKPQAPQAENAPATPSPTTNPSPDHFDQQIQNEDLDLANYSFGKPPSPRDMVSPSPSDDFSDTYNPNNNRNASVSSVSNKKPFSRPSAVSVDYVSREPVIPIPFLSQGPPPTNNVLLTPKANSPSHSQSPKTPYSPHEDFYNIPILNPASPNPRVTFVFPKTNSSASLQSISKQIPQVPFLETNNTSCPPTPGSNPSYSPRKKRQKEIERRRRSSIHEMEQTMAGLRFGIEGDHANVEELAESEGGSDSDIGY